MKSDIICYEAKENYCADYVMKIKIIQFINMLPEQYQAFIYEIQNWNNIPISSKNCGIGCLFCKVHQDPVLKRFPVLPEITLAELYEGFKYVTNKIRFIRLGAGVMVAPHTDPFLHPLIYDFIRHTSDFFSEMKVTTVTTGSYILPEKIEFLKSIPNFGIDLSLITMQNEREQIVPNATRNILNTLLKSAPIRKISLMFTGSLDTLKRDLDLLFTLGWQNRCNEILVRRIEKTKYSKGKLETISDLSINEYEKCVDFLKSNYPSIVFTVPYLSEKFKGSNNDYFIQAEERFSQLLAKIENTNNNFDILCSESVYEYFSNKFLNVQKVRTYKIKNNLYGGSVTVAGLLNHSDITHSYKPERNAIIVLPFEMYDSDNRDITGRPLSELKNIYNTVIWKA